MGDYLRTPGVSCNVRILQSRNDGNLLFHVQLFSGVCAGVHLGLDQNHHRHHLLRVPRDIINRVPMDIIRIMAHMYEQTSQNAIVRSNLMISNVTC